jgi:hypothetical protein
LVANSGSNGVARFKDEGERFEANHAGGTGHLSLLACASESRVLDQDRVMMGRRTRTRSPAIVSVRCSRGDLNFVVEELVGVQWTLLEDLVFV